MTISKKSVNGEIVDYVFRDFHGNSLNLGDSEVRDYELATLDFETVEKKESKKKLLKIERRYAKKNKFEMSPIVKRFRGVDKQEDEEYESRVSQEASRRLEKHGAEAYKKGYEEGVRQGTEDIYNQTKAATEEKLTLLSSMISEVLATKEEMVQNQKTQIYEMIRNFTKWVILRELKDDNNYLERLLEKLLIEMRVQSNILIQVNQKDFEQMPEVLESIKDRFENMSNVRLEIDYDIKSSGLILESENGIINGTLFEQFKSIDKLFESVGLKPDEE